MTHLRNERNRTLDSANPQELPKIETHYQMLMSTSMPRRASAFVLEVPLMSPSSRLDSCAKIERRVPTGIKGAPDYRKNMKRTFSEHNGISPVGRFM
jgi:hypothetical protein